MSTHPRLGWTAGHPTVFTANSLGLIDHEHATKFEPEHVHAGDKGRYIGPHPYTDLADQGWHLIAVHVNGRDLLCPCHESQFEAL